MKSLKSFKEGHVNEGKNIAQGPFMRKLNVQQGDQVVVHMTASGAIGESGKYTLPVVKVNKTSITCKHPNGKSIRFRLQDGTAIGGVKAHIVGKK